MAEYDNDWEISRGTAIKRKPDAPRTARQAHIDEQVKAVLDKQSTDDEVQRRLALAAGYGSDEWDDLTTFRFQKEMPRANGSFAYTYVMIKLGGKWYTTGQLGFNGVDWSAIVTWLVSGAFPVAYHELEYMAGRDKSIVTDFTNLEAKVDALMIDKGRLMGELKVAEEDLADYKKSNEALRRSNEKLSEHNKSMLEKLRALGYNVDDDEVEEDRKFAREAHQQAVAQTYGNLGTQLPDGDPPF